jgi:hypothetical protein
LPTGRSPRGNGDSIRCVRGRDHGVSPENGLVPSLSRKLAQSAAENYTPVHYLCRFCVSRQRGPQDAVVGKRARGAEGRPSTRRAVRAYRLAGGRGGKRCLSSQMGRLARRWAKKPHRGAERLFPLVACRSPVRIFHPRCRSHRLGEVKGQPAAP